MTSVSPVAHSSRRAALLVHAMPGRDQAWLLGSLAPEQRVELELLLEELRDLGIPADEGMLREVVEAAPIAAVPGAVTDTAPDWHARLERAAETRMPHLAAMLQKEAPLLVATLLASRDWSWKPGVLQAIDPGVLQRVEAARPNRAAVLQQAIGEAVIRQLETCAPVAGPPARPGWPRLLPIRWKRA